MLPVEAVALWRGVVWLNALLAASQKEGFQTLVLERLNHNPL